MTSFRLDIMENSEIALLGVGVAPIPLNVRVIRKWKPGGRPNETCYLFVDKQVSNNEISSVKTYHC